MRCMSVYHSVIPPIGVAYRENAEYGPSNLRDKQARQAEGAPFEWPNMVALNQAVASLIRDAKKIVNIGAGTGTFEWFAAVDKSLKFLASESDAPTLEWCRENRRRENIEYTALGMDEIVERYGTFDLAVAIDVIEHVADFAGFLRGFARLAPRAVVTTPNRDRDLSAAVAVSPAYCQHVREWDAGEFYWVLRTFYKKVELFAQPDQYVPFLEPVGALTVMTPLVAVCEGPGGIAR